MESLKRQQNGRILRPSRSAAARRGVVAAVSAAHWSCRPWPPRSGHGWRTRCARVHRHRSWVKNKVLMRAVAIRECCPPTLPSHPARSFTACLRLPLLRYGIRRLFTLLWLHGRRKNQPPIGLARGGLYDGLESRFGQCNVVWWSFLEFLQLRSLLYII